MFDITGKAAFITGGTAGIGLACAQRFIDAGAWVMIVGHRDGGARIAEQIGAAFHRVDVQRETDIVAALDAAVVAFDAIDIVLNNAGVGNTGPTIEESPAADFKGLINYDLKAPYAVMHQVPSRMRDGGTIINTASIAGQVQLSGHSQYSAVKDGVNSLTKRWRWNWRRAIFASMPSALAASGRKCCRLIIRRWPS
ncbi:MAG: SDR family NAD(P)-dependent oxidoreductase [Parahaliea sp.]